MLYIFYLIFFPFKILELTHPIKVLDPNVERGGTVRLQLEFEKFGNYAVTPVKYIICDDGNLVTVASPNKKTNLPAGRHTLILTFPVPEKTSTGRCHYELNNVYHINPLRNETLLFISEAFRVYNVGELPE